jgi:fatty-acyl-CoA synthase
MSTQRLYGHFADAAERWPDRPLFTFLRHGEPAKVYTAAELLAVAETIADRFRHRDLDSRQAPLGLLLRSQEAQTLHYLAALRAGAIPAILTPPNPKLNREYYAATMAEVLRRSGFRALVTDLESTDFELPTFAPGDLAPRREDGGPPIDGKDGVQLEASFLQYSSGTTGIKRGVLVTDDAVLAQLRTYASAIRLDRDDRIISWLPLYHDMGFIACLNLPLLYGVPTVVLDPVEWVSRPASFLQAASESAATLSWNPNFAYAFMAQRVRDKELEGLDLSSLRALVNCSEPVTLTSQQRFVERLQPYGLREDVFKGCYAMAETTFALTHGEPDDPASLDSVGPSNGARSNHGEPYVSVGRPLDGVEVRVVDEEGDDCPDRRIGEIWVRSPFNFRGYLGDDEATERAFSNDWYRTGDLGYRVGDAFYITGRLQDVLIVGGVNVFPGDLENVVGEVAGVHPGRAVAFSRFDPRAQTERITVLAESHLEGQEGMRAVVEIRQRLLSAFQIANFDVALVPAGWLVKSSSGKMARPANKAKWEEQGSGGLSPHDLVKS